MPFLLLPLDRMLQALLDAIEYIFGRIGILAPSQRMQEQHGIQSGIIGARADARDEGGNFTMQFRLHAGMRALRDQLQLFLRRHLAPLARFGQHALTRNEIVRHMQAGRLYRAGKTQEHAPLLLDQFGAERLRMQLGRHAVVRFRGARKETRR